MSPGPGSVPRLNSDCAATVRLGDVDAQLDRTADYALAPLRWAAEEDLLYDPWSRTLHRPSCHVARECQPVRSVPAGSAVELVWAPRMCECGSDVTLALGDS